MWHHLRNLRNILRATYALTSEFRIQISKKTLWYENSFRSDILAGLKVETNAPEICLSKFVILIQALLFLFNNVAAAFLRRRRRLLKIISVAAKRWRLLNAAILKNDLN